jgi:hypothetical protein
MNITRLLGAVTLATGSSLLLSEPFLGHELLMEVTGLFETSLYLLCFVSIVLGAIAMKVGSLEDQDLYRSQAEKIPQRESSQEPRLTNEKKEP